MPIEIKCSTCGELTAVFTPAGRDVDIVIEIDPCATCLDEYDEVVRKAEELQAVVDAVDKTADGVPIIMSDHPIVFVFTKRTGLYRPGESADWWEMPVKTFDGEYLRGMVAGTHMGAFRPGDCYSTLEAAEAAREEAGS